MLTRRAGLLLVAWALAGAPAWAQSRSQWVPVDGHRPHLVVTGDRGPTDEVYDLVIDGGRVVDPASGLDAIRSLGIRAGKIAVVSDQPLRGRERLDATGMVVAPGFIDLHQHAQHAEGYRVQALDGTTTALELEEGTADVDEWYASRAGRSLINHGVSVGHAYVRMRVMQDPGRSAPAGAAATDGANDRQLAAIRAAIDEGLRQGAVAVGLLIEYTPGARPWEVFEVFRAAAARNATVHVHLRSLEEPQYFLETEEIIAAAAASGASAHIVHIQSSGGDDTPRMLELIRGARARGIDVTTEVYPYTAAMTGIENPGYGDWESWPDSKFGRFEWPATGERLTRESFAKYRKTGGLVVDHANTESVVTEAIRDPLPMIASDGVLERGVGHPRVAGTFARVLGRYVRDLRVLTLMDALRRMTVEPARRLERRVPAMAFKGRLAPGADADIVVFDPATIADRATFREPARPAEGIRDVLVGGTFVVRGGAVQEETFPGRAVRAQGR